LRVTEGWQLHALLHVAMQVDRHDKRLRQMAAAYRASRSHVSLLRYFKLKRMINDAVSELRMQ